MPVPTHMKFVFRGIYFGSEEEWSTSLKVSRDNPGGADASYGEIVESTVDDACAAFFGTSLFSSAVRLTEWRAYVIGTNGLTEGNPMIRELATPIQGTASATPRYPSDVAVCVTTEAINRGPARYGRFFLPSPAHPMNNDWRWHPTDITTLLNATVNFAKSVTDAVDLELTQSAELLNISKGTPRVPSTLVSGVRQTVDRLKIGLRPDRISRRARAHLEEHIASGTIDW